LPGLTVYAVVIQSDTGRYLDDADGGFAVAPADKYQEVAEDAALGGRYHYEESRTVWADGPYEIVCYAQAGGAPAPLTDKPIASTSFVLIGDSVPSAGSSIISGLCSLADVKRVLKIGGASFDQAITDKIAAAEQYFRDETDYHLTAADHTEYFSPGYRDFRVSADLSRLRIKDHPIISVVSINDDAARAWDAGSLVPADDYYFDRFGVYLLPDKGKRSFTAGVQTVRAIVRSGYETPPANLRNAVAHYAAWLYYQDESGRMRSGIASESIGDATVTYLDQEAPKIVAAAIRQYRRPCGL
jgi:hypothetical protein